MAKKKTEVETKTYCDYCEHYGATKVCSECITVFNEETQEYLTPTRYEHVEVMNSVPEGLPCAHCKYMSVNRIDDPCRECIENFAKTGEAINFCTRKVDSAPKPEEDPVPKFVDNVNHPSHYADSTSIECIESMELTFGTEAVYHFAVCNAYKYLWRHKNKGKVEEDLNKANWYYHKARNILKKPSQEDMLISPYEQNRLSTLKFYIDDYACRAGIKLKEVYIGGKAV